MTTLSTISPTAVLAVNVRFSEDALRVSLSDGREISVPIEWFPRLRNATPAQRNKWRLIARGIGIHWEEIDEDIAVTTLLRFYTAHGRKLRFSQSGSGGLKSCLSAWKSAKSRLICQPEGLPGTEQAALAPRTRR